MSEHRVIFIEHPAHLSIDTGRLKIKQSEKEPTYIAPKDIAVLCLHHSTITITQSALLTLAEMGGTVLTTNQRHMPVAMQLPLSMNVKMTSRLYQQINLQDSVIHKHCWQQIVKSRLNGQTKILEQHQSEGINYMKRLSNRVELDDVGNAESQGARHFWRHWLGKPHKRIKQGAIDPINSELNFGYAIIRSFIARAIVSAGLNPALGIHHRNKENHHNLVDDFIEPFRYLVEEHVQADLPNSELTPNRKIYLAEVVKKTVCIQGHGFRFSAAVQECIDSYVRVLESKKQGKLNLPMME